MPLISLSSALALTGKSERTLWRLVAEGRIHRELVQGKALFDLDSLTPHLAPSPSDDDFPLIESADQGDADAQTDLALILLERFENTGKYRDAAFYWLQLAAAQNHADAMNWLGYCHIQGFGVEKNEEMGLMWLAKSAAQGHEISRVQMAGILDRSLKNS